jgi:hypothetical protein
MDDTKLEERLRRALRTEGDSIPLGVTSDQLQMRVRLRRSERTNRRLAVGMAAALVAAIGAGGLLLANRGITPPVGNSAAPSASPEPSASPLASAIAVSSPAPVADIALYPGWQSLGRLSGPDGDLQASVSGELPTGVRELLVSAACQGTGSLSIGMTGDTQLAVDCPTSPTTPSRQLSSVGDVTHFQVQAVAIGNITFQVLIEGSDAAIHIPPVVIRHGLDEAAMGNGCGITISLSWGYSAGDSCATTLPPTPLKTLELSKDTLPTVTINGWTITTADALCGRIVASPGEPSLFEATKQCRVSASLVEQTIIIMGLPAATEPWAVELTLTAQNAAGDSFSGPFYAYVHFH